MSGYGLDTAPPALSAFLAGLTDAVRAALAPDLVAVLLHGSLAMGCFYPPKSDIDLLVVVAGDLADAKRQWIYDVFAARHATRPYAAGIEMSVIRRDDIANPVHPLPYLVHFGDNTTGPPVFENAQPPRDPDLIAHLMVAAHRGVSLVGPPPAALIGPIDWDDYVAAVRYDLDELVGGETVVKAPRYAVLNLCRWAMMQRTGDRRPPSKEEAGMWALDHLLSEHRPLIAQALAVYRSDAPVAAGDLISAGGPWDRAALLAFRDWARTMLAGG